MTRTSCATVALLTLASTSCRKGAPRERIQPVASSESTAPAHDAVVPGLVRVATGEHLDDFQFAGEGRLAFCSGGDVVEVDVAERRRSVLVANAHCARLVADSAAIAWIERATDGSKATNPVWLFDRVAAKARVLGRFVGPAIEQGVLRLDEHDVYILRGYPEVGLHGDRDRELLAFPRAGGPSRVVVPRPGPNTFALDETHVYWQHGSFSTGEISRRGKTGGSSFPVIKAEQGNLFVVGGAVYLNDWSPVERDLRRVPVTGGTFETLPVRAEGLVAGRERFCWIAHRHVSCCGTDSVIHSVEVPIEARALAVSGGSVALATRDGDDDSLWLLPVPR